MILIRGIKGESYARKIEKGIVDCRDVLSATLHPPVTGYGLSDYYEKNFVKALAYCVGETEDNFRDPKFLYSILIDYFIPYIYLTYFHILNEHSLEWLEKFDDDCKFIALNVKLDRITQTAIGKGYFGAKISYVDNIRQISQEEPKEFYVACMCSLENLFTDKSQMNLPLRFYNTLAFPLLCREQDERFTDLENEFRIFSYDCPQIQNGMIKQISRDVVLSSKTGIRYTGTIDPGINSELKSSSCILKNPYKKLCDILNEEQGQVFLDSRFKSIDIREISSDYRYLGGKKACEKYIDKMNKSKPEEIYVDRTIRKKYKINDIPDAVYLPSYQKIDY